MRARGNGVGKTSLLRAIVGQRPIAGGTVTFNGQDITRLPTPDRAALGIGFVPQGREVFPLLTVKENLETGFARLPRKERNVPDEIFQLFPVLRSMMGRRGGDLSGRSAAAARHRPRPGDAPEPPGAG